MKSLKRKTLLKAALVSVLAVGLLVTGLVLLNREDDRLYAESRGSMTEGFGQLKTVTWNGVTYREKPAVTTLLIAGIDKQEAALNASETSYRSGGQADFLLLLAIDHTDKLIHQLQIDRDTMADVQILGVFGNEVGTRVLQICLAHSYGATPEDNAKYTVRAVQNLLGGMEIDGYYMIDYSAIGALNDKLGGVTVRVEYDMTSVNPAWTRGSTVRLRGKEAETFVRTRKTIGDGSNRERMDRQNEFMKNAISQMNRSISRDLSFGEELLNSLKELAVTNLTQKRLAEELNEAHSYRVLEVSHPAGEYTIGSDGFIEFHMKQDNAVEWVLEHLYTRQ